MHETIIVNFHPNDYSFFSSFIRLKLQVNEPKHVFLPKIGGSQSNQYDGKMGTGNGSRVDKKSEVFIVPIEAYPKMNLSMKNGYLPKMIGRI